MAKRFILHLALLSGLFLPQLAFPQVAVKVSPGNQRIRAGQDVKFSATVTGTTADAPKTVKWSVNGIPNGSATYGLIKAEGKESNEVTYCAPTDVPAKPEVTITATSDADPNEHADITVTLYEEVITLTPRSVTLVTDAKEQFTATVTDAPGNDNRFAWSVNGHLNGTSKLGKIDNGLYTAPLAVPDPAIVTITATSLADINKSASAQVTVVPVSPGPAPVAAAPTTAKPTPSTAKQGVPLNVDLTVQGNVTAQAVLIPQRVAKAVFGGKIASEYAVVQYSIEKLDMQVWDFFIAPGVGK